MSGLDFGERLSNAPGRQIVLAQRFSMLIHEFCPKAKLGCDVGCGEGLLAALMAKRNDFPFCGIEPWLPAESETRNGMEVRRGWAHSMPYDDESFDVVTLTSVYEHILPWHRVASFKEMNRVLGKGGILLGQIPNMNFPIEPHSLLPLQQYLPKSIAETYFRKFSPVPWRKGEVNWYKVGPKHLIADAREGGFTYNRVDRFNYPLEVVPRILKIGAMMLRPIPMGYVFCFTKK